MSIKNIRSALKTDKALSTEAANALALIVVARDEQSVTGSRAASANPVSLAAAQAYAGLLDCDLMTNDGKPLGWSGPGLPLALYADSLADLDEDHRRVIAADAARVLTELMSRPVRRYLHQPGALDAATLAELDRERRSDARDQDVFGEERASVGEYFGERVASGNSTGYYVAAKRDPQGKPLADWLAILSNIQGVEIQGRAREGRTLSVRANAEGLARMESRLGHCCHIERAIKHRASA